MKDKAFYIFLSGVRRSLLQFAKAIEVYLRAEGEAIE